MACKKKKRGGRGR